MKSWVFKTAVGTAITMTVGGVGIWISSVNAQGDRITKLEVIIPEMRDDVKEIKEDVKELRRRR